MGYRLNTGVETGGVPMYILKEFLKEIDIEVFIELGTASGDSVKEASKYFKECITVEINPKRPEYDLGIKNIKWENGRSIDLLPQIVNNLVIHKTDKVKEGYRYAAFWVDSHFDGDKPNDSEFKDCYLLEELDIISWYAQDAIVIIDDARLFLGNPPHPNKADEWPLIQDVFKKFDDKFKFHFTTICDDYIISFPDRIKWIYDRLWMRDYKIRYPDEPDKIKNAVKLAYNSFLKYME